MKFTCNIRTLVSLAEKSPRISKIFSPCIVLYGVFMQILLGWSLCNICAFAKAERAASRNGSTQTAEIDKGLDCRFQSVFPIKLPTTIQTSKTAPASTTYYHTYIRSLKTLADSRPSILFLWRLRPHPSGINGSRLGLSERQSPAPLAFCLTRSGSSTSIQQYMLRFAFPLLPLTLLLSPFLLVV